MDYLTRPWRLYGDLSGRASRREVAAFDVTFLATLALAILIPGAAAPWLATIGHRPGAASGGVMLALVGFVLLFSAPPLVAVHVRRLHDTGRSGWWVLLLGGAPLLLLPGTLGRNRYGEDPRGPTAARRGGKPAQGATDACGSMTPWRAMS
ncbi:DUF805 domain-containing protein [Sphingomonas sp. DT-51]|uniref:DUF805 domain-containing protein n=1 Tax=Sphingomonas sp. DT-51 TaxID=3396165 RepID=UPI003F19EEF9